MHVKSCGLADLRFNRYLFEHVQPDSASLGLLHILISSDGLGFKCGIDKYHLYVNVLREPLEVLPMIVAQGSDSPSYSLKQDLLTTHQAYIDHKLKIAVRLPMATYLRCVLFGFVISRRPIAPEPS